MKSGSRRHFASFDFSTSTTTAWRHPDGKAARCRSSTWILLFCPSRDSPDWPTLRFKRAYLNECSTAYDCTGEPGRLFVRFNRRHGFTWFAGLVHWVQSRKILFQALLFYYRHRLLLWCALVVHVGTLRVALLQNAFRLSTSLCIVRARVYSPCIPTTNADPPFPWTDLRTKPAGDSPSLLR